jgi:hypothetical protein
MDQLLDILKKNQLSITEGRKKILELFLKIPVLTGLLFTERYRLLLRKESYTISLQPIILSYMLCAKTIAKRATTTITMCILYAMFVIKQFAWIM